MSATKFHTHKCFNNIQIKFHLQRNSVCTLLLDEKYLLRVSSSVYEQKCNAAVYHGNARMCECLKTDTSCRFPMSCQICFLIYQEARCLRG
jgi:hypothetical protein